MKYLVPVDGSPNANVAFNAALKMINKEHDVLLILNVIEDLLVYSGFPDAPISVYSAAQEYAKSESKKTLLKYARVCIDEGINYKSLSTISNHVGDSICHIVDEYNVDFLFIGRRGMSKLKRFFIGSTSRYCVENANANVVVVKEGAIEDFAEPTLQKHVHEVVSSSEKPESFTASSGHPTEKIGKEEVPVKTTVPPAPPNILEQPKEVSSEKPLDAPIPQKEEVVKDQPKVSPSASDIKHEQEKKPSHPLEKHSKLSPKSLPHEKSLLQSHTTTTNIKEQHISLSAPAPRHVSEKSYEQKTRSLSTPPSSAPIHDTEKLTDLPKSDKKEHSTIHPSYAEVVKPGVSKEHLKKEKEKSEVVKPASHSETPIKSTDQ